MSAMRHDFMALNHNKSGKALYLTHVMVIIAIWLLISYAIFTLFYKLSIDQLHYSIGLIAQISWLYVSRKFSIKAYRNLRLLPVMRQNWPYVQYVYKTDATTLYRTVEPVSECLICFNDYVNGQRVLELNCHHSAHRQCIMNWAIEKGNRECFMCRRAYNEWPRHGREHVHYDGGMKRYIKNGLCWCISSMLDMIWEMIRYIGGLVQFVLMCCWDCICSIPFALQGWYSGSDTFDIDPDYTANKQKWYIERAYSS